MIIISHPTAVAEAWLGHPLRLSVCLSVCTALKGKRLELTLQTLDMSVHDSQWACTDPEIKGSKVKRQRHAVSECAAGMGLHVDMTVQFTSCIYFVTRKLRLNVGLLVMIVNCSVDR